MFERRSDEDFVGLQLRDLHQVVEGGDQLWPLLQLSFVVAGVPLFEEDGSGVKNEVLEEGAVMQVESALVESLVGFRSGVSSAG